MKKYIFYISLLISIVPAALFALFFFNEITSISEDHILSSIEREIDIGAANFRQFLLERQGNIEEWAENPNIKVALEFKRPEELVRHLKFLKLNYPIYEEISIFDNNGNPFANTGSVNGNRYKLIPPHSSKTQIYFDTKKLILKKSITSSEVLCGYIETVISPGIVEQMKKQVYSHVAIYNLDALEIFFKNTSESISKETEVCRPVSGAFELCATFDLHSMGKIKRKIASVVILVSLLFTGFIFFTLKKVLEKIVAPYGNLLQSLEELARDKFSYVRFDSKLDELKDIESRFNYLIDELKLASIRSSEQVKLQAEMQISRQVAHDIRSPVTAIKVAIESIENLPDDIRSLLGNATERIESISRDLLDKRNSIDLKLEYISYVVDYIVQEKNSEYSRLFPNLRITFVSTENFLAIINKDIFSRIISNLLNNSAEANSTKITISVARHENKLCLEIEDNGAGIPKEQLSLIYNEGYSYAKKSTGLGLFHARKHVIESGGQLLVESTIGEGTKVTIFLPLVPCSIPLHKDKVIVVDDDLNMLNVWKNKLSFLGIQVLGFESIESYILSNNPDDDLIFIDQDLGHESISGIEFIKSNNNFKKMILITNRFDEATVLKDCVHYNIPILPKILLENMEANYSRGNYSGILSFSLNPS